MKNLLLLIFSFCLLQTSTAQNNLQLLIHNKLGNVDFGLNTAAPNNLENNFNVTRLEYYLAEITITHDGGIETPIEDYYILHNAEDEDAYELGLYNINQVEGISFHVGVEEHSNHLDPSIFNSHHPLAPHFPSMHWGWAAGYRFIAMEGYGGNNLNQIYQLHGLGDENYFKTEVEVSTTVIDGVVKIQLDADYTRALENINVNAGVVEHGSTGAAKQILENFRDYVFNPTPISTSNIDFSEVKSFKVFPNPSIDGNTMIKLQADQNLKYDIAITDLLGRKIQRFNQVNSNADLKVMIKNPGLYLINLIKEGQNIITEKLTVY